MLLGNMRGRSRAVGTLSATRGSVLSMTRLLFHSVFAAAAPVINSKLSARAVEEEGPVEGGDLVALYIFSAILVLAGGAFAGLTIALMGQDDVYLQVLAGDASEPQNKNAQRVYDLLKRGKHWVLVTLLLSNVIVNETLPVVLDRCLGGGVAAVIGSTALIVIFGEVLPQSICVRFGLQIGGFMAKPVLVMMWLMAPLSWPIAKLLDWILGEDHPTVYKKSGLKQLVNLHQTLGDVSNRLNADEVTIISAVLDLKDKPVRDVMTPMDDVFIMSEDTILDERTMDRILSAGYSRIPIHAPGSPRNFVGMLLVKILITYDPEDCSRVSDFPLATLPETRPETSCLDIVNFFQEGKSHMVVVSACPGEDHGAMGVVTLEDVIEELIGEEIIDESDVYIDVHKAIRRLTPAPKARINRQEPIEAADFHALNTNLTAEDAIIASELSNSPRPVTATFMMRAPSSDGRPGLIPVAVKANLDEMRQQLKHLGPSNPATNPKDTKLASVKIKHVLGSPAMRPVISNQHAEHEHRQEEENVGNDERTPLLSSAVQDVKGNSTNTYADVQPSKIEIEIPTSMHAQPPTSKSPTTPPAKRLSSSSAGSGSHSPELNIYRTPGGVITESIIETGGVRKIVIHTSSSGDEAASGKVPSGSMATASLSTGRDGSGNEGDSDNESRALLSTTDASGVNATSGAADSITSSKKKNKKKKKKTNK
ncbi:Protein MAM3 [Ceratocystis lukuohia]|uniref:Protein MAM3 n=1 Tax=Ceratocystis lukuohia TaxID=2019550 RepID=A0ABR4MER0_9PEZI